MTKPKRKPRAAFEPSAMTWLYLIGRTPTEAANRLHGTIKIGTTTDPAGRMRAHGISRVQWRHFSTCGPRLLILEIERSSMAALARVGRRIGNNGSEEFNGIDKATAIAVVRNIAARVREQFPDFVRRKAAHQAQVAAWRAFRQRLYHPAALDESEPEAA